MVYIGSKMVRRLEVDEEPMGVRFSNVVPHRAGRWVNCTWLCCNNTVGIPWTLSRFLFLWAASAPQVRTCLVVSAPPLRIPRSSTVLPRAST